MMDKECKKVPSSQKKKSKKRMKTRQTARKAVAMDVDECESELREIRAKTVKTEFQELDTCKEYQETHYYKNVHGTPHVPENKLWPNLA